MSDHPSRGLLPSLDCLSVIDEHRKVGLGPLRLSSLVEGRILNKFHACCEFLCSLHLYRVTHFSLITGTTQNKDELQWKRKAGDNNGKSARF
jgi:hypothetical protein